MTTANRRRAADARRAEGPGPERSGTARSATGWRGGSPARRRSTACWLAIRLGLSAHQVTAAAWLLVAGGRGGDRHGGRGRCSSSGVALAHLAFWLDHVDGQVARWRGTASLDGVYLDYLMHHAANLATGLRAGIRPGRPLGRPALDDRRLRDRRRLGAA